MTENNHSSELAAAFRRTAALGGQPVDRTGWTTEQWAQEAEEIMVHIDGAVSALKNGHIGALLKLNRQLKHDLATAKEPVMLTGRSDLTSLNEGSAALSKDGYVLEKIDDGDGSPMYWATATNTDIIYTDESLPLPAQLLLRR